MAVKEAHNATEILISKALTHLLEWGVEITHDTLILTLDDKRKNSSDPDYCQAIHEVQAHQHLSSSYHSELYRNGHLLH